MPPTDDPTTHERLALAHRAVELAGALLAEARAKQMPEEHAQAKKLSRMVPQHGLVGARRAPAGRRWRITSRA